MLQCSNKQPASALEGAVVPASGHPEKTKEPPVRSLSDTLARLARWRAASIDVAEPGGPGRLTEVHGFGSNPGALGALEYRPAGLADGAPLVVVLHGCKQTAAGYDHGTGWSALADRLGFALLFPEQRRANNPNLCFNWFQPGDVRRGSGEVESIHQMVLHAKARLRSDPRRVFVTGLSAGGAMTAAMLAAYPETFAGGAVVAGLAYGVAATVPEAFDRMRGSGLGGDARLQALVREASGHTGPWPTLSVWHGSADQTVVPSNADALITQWRGLHGLAVTPSVNEIVRGHRRRVWRDRDGREAIESYTIAGLGHGTPIDPASGVGAPGAFILSAGISSTHLIAGFWGLDGAAADQPVAAGAARPDRQAAGPGPVPVAPPRDLVRVPETVAARADFPRAAAPERRAEPSRPGMDAPPRAPDRPQPTGVQKVIEDALRAAGLMR